MYLKIQRSITRMFGGQKCFDNDAKLFAKSPPFISELEDKVIYQYCVENENLTQLIRNRMIADAKQIHFSNESGVRVKKDDLCAIEVTDQPVDGEHFVAGEIQLLSGLNYFLFETLPTSAQLIIYLIGEKTSLLFPWVNSTLGAEKWSHFGDEYSLVGVFHQVGKAASKLEKLKLVIYSRIDQKIQLRWQHGANANTTYKGKIEQRSIICRAQYGYIVDEGYPMEEL